MHVPKSADVKEKFEQCLHLFPFSKFSHAGSPNTSLIIDASANNSTINGDTGVTLEKYDTPDILGIEVLDADNNIWEISQLL